MLINLVKKCLIISVYCTALCYKRFESPHSLDTSKKKLRHIANINIWSHNLIFSEKIVLYLHFTTLCCVQGARKKLKGIINPYNCLLKNANLSVKTRRFK